MGDRVASYEQPLPATVLVLPVLGLRTLGVVANKYKFRPSIQVRIVYIGIWLIGVPTVHDFDVISFAAIGTDDL